MLIINQCMKLRLFYPFQKRKCNKLLKFLVAVWGDHCNCSPRATKNVATLPRDTQTAERRHTKRTLLPTSKVLHAEGRTDKHMCYLTVQTPVCWTSVLVARLVARPQLPAGISASSSNMWNQALHHFQPPAVTNYFMNPTESFFRN